MDWGKNPNELAIIRTVKKARIPKKEFRTIGGVSRSIWKYGLLPAQADPKSVINKMALKIHINGAYICI